MFDAASHAPPVRVALSQMACQSDPEGNVCRALEAIRSGGRTGSGHHLPAGTVRQPVSVPERRPRQLRSGRADSGSDE